jgi:transposase
MPAKTTTNSVSPQKVFVGIDVHLKQWSVSIFLENNYFKTISADPSAKQLASFLQKNFPKAEYYSAYEAGFCGFSVHRELIALGIRNIICNPADIPTNDKERKQKEDKRDSKKIASCLKNGDLRGIYVPSVEMMDFRTFVRHRKDIVEKLSSSKTKIKAFLHFNGIKIPKELNTASTHWSNRFTDWLQSLQMGTGYGQKSLDSLLKNIDHFRKELLYLNRELRIAEQEGIFAERLKRLRTIPGIGLITACTILSEVDDIHRFKDTDSFCSYIGLVPSTYSSGEKEINYGITKRANNAVRSVIVEAAWIATRLDPSMATKFNALSYRMKQNEAIIRIAKSLIKKVRYVLKNEKDYIPM